MIRLKATTDRQVVRIPLTAVPAQAPSVLVLVLSDLAGSGSVELEAGLSADEVWGNGGYALVEVTAGGFRAPAGTEYRYALTGDGETLAEGLAVLAPEPGKGPDPYLEFGGQVVYGQWGNGIADDYDGIYGRDDK